MFKASLKRKAAAGDEEDSDWEDVEEDFPHVKLSELLDGLTLEVNNNGEEDEEFEDDEDESGKQVSFAATEEEKKQ